MKRRSVNGVRRRWLGGGLACAVACAIVAGVALQATYAPFFAAAPRVAIGGTGGHSGGGGGDGGAMGDRYEAWVGSRGFGGHAAGNLAWFDRCVVDQ